MSPTPSPVPASPTLAGLRLDPTQAALLVIDVQTKLTAAMPTQALAVSESNTLILIDLARRLGMPVVSSEQYPKGLGPTVPALAAALESGEPSQTTRFEKLTFSCTDDESFPAIFQRLARRQWIVAGMETHICVWQTVRGLLGWDATVHLASDATLARTANNHAVGLSLMARAGAVISSTETIAFDALVRAGTDDFRAISRQIKNVK